MMTWDDNIALIPLTLSKPHLTPLALPMQGLERMEAAFMMSHVLAKWG
jgi:hypothetical protein